MTIIVSHDILNTRVTNNDKLLRGGNMAKHKPKRKVGDKVIIREDLERGRKYFMDGGNKYDYYTATHVMLECKGKEAVITHVGENYYYVDVCKAYSRYTDEMFYDEDKVVESYSEETENLIQHMLSISKQQILDVNIDKALANKDETKFMELTERLLTKDSKSSIL